MKFHDYINVTKGLDPRILLQTTDNPLSYRHICYELNWNNLNRPYYNVYPAIIPMLTSLKLDMAGTYVKPPGGLKHILLRLPDANHTLISGDIAVRTIFMSFQNCLKSAGIRNTVPRDLTMDPIAEITDDIAPYVSKGLVIGIDIGEEIDGCAVSLIRLFPTDHRLLEESISTLHIHDSYYDGVLIPNELVLNCIRLCITICLLDNNTELIVPDVLSKDYNKYLDSNDQAKDKLVDKAKRRGKFGFTLGKNLEKIPHVRRPHPALVWTGIGRKIPKIIMRSGSIVHREKIEKVPTGYLS